MLKSPLRPSYRGESAVPLGRSALVLGKLSAFRQWTQLARRFSCCKRFPGQHSHATPFKVAGDAVKACAPRPPTTPSLGYQELPNSLPKGLQVQFQGPHHLFLSLLSYCAYPWRRGGQGQLFVCVCGLCGGLGCREAFI